MAGLRTCCTTRSVQLIGDLQLEPAVPGCAPVVVTVPDRFDPAIVLQARDRQLYHLRHTRDYEALGIPIGASKADAKAAYRQLAKVRRLNPHPSPDP